MKRPRLARSKPTIILYLAFSFSISSPSSSSSLVDAIVIPPARWGHVSVLCGNQLYIQGGHTGVNPMTAPIGSDLYSLDVSAAFNSFTVPWAQLTPGPYASYHAAGLLGPTNNLFAIFGGNTSFSSSPSSNSNSLNLYDTVSGTWAVSPLQDPPRREQAAAVSRLGDGIMYVIGGMVLSPDLNTESATAELWSIGGYITLPTNTTNSTSPEPPKTTQPPGLTPQTVGWQKLASPSSPSGSDRAFHTATIIRSNGLIVLIGGVSGGALVPMSEIAVYDTAAGTWSVQTATGATPPLRRNHVAVATNTGQIYVHGGTDLGATTFFADLAILDTTSWSWSQPAMDGNAPTGRYSHAATMVGSNIIMTFGAYYVWNMDTERSNPDIGRSRVGVDVAAIVGGLIAAAALAAVLVVAVRRHRRHKIQNSQHKATALYASDYSYTRNSHLEEDAYRPTGMAFNSAPLSFGQRVGQALGGIAFWRRSGDRRGRSANASYSQRLGDRDEDDGGMRGLQTGPYPSDQEIFMDAVHRARSRAGHLSPLFTPLQQPISQSPPISPRSPRSSAGFSYANVGVGGSAGSGPGVHYSGPGVTLTDVHIPILNRDGEEVPHGRAYSDGFENAMQEMDIQMLAVPRGRLYVVNPSDETLTQDFDYDPNQGPGQGHDNQGGEDPYRQFDSQAPKP
ncbi:hypothetical protein KI688_011113 [Linnemannia hyalina]|uniref:Galactose oxidase n=1 Tax=Linnemannia hyalina TaxID=64524 RepID=A0A9P7XYB7_9FUNG|nr:hypothetical protein KI688_011113 [Linnemannia hyalina]